MFKTGLSILLTVAAFVPPGNEQTRRGRRAATEKCPDERSYTGKYRNFAYGFSIVIPAGLKGYWNSARCVHDEKHGCVCMGDHGRFIPLSEDANIEAYVGYQMEPDLSLIDLENADIQYLKNHEGIEQVRVAGSRWFRLGRLHARRFVVRFVEKKREVVREHIIALHGGVE
jgi:hypothetical protein